MQFLSKKALREAILQRRDDLAHAERRRAARRLVSWFPLLFPRKNEIIAGYWPIRSEIDPRPLMRVLRAQGVRLALPVIEGQHLVFRHYEKGRPLIRGHYGIYSPDQSCRLCLPDRVLIPVCAYDQMGTRIGYGGGYYDRTFAQLPTIPERIGIAYSLQALASLIRRESHDIPLESVLTEKGLHVFNRCQVPGVRCQWTGKL